MTICSSNKFANIFLLFQVLKGALRFRVHVCDVISSALSLWVPALYSLLFQKKKKTQLNKYLVIYHGVSCFLLLVVYVCVCAYMCVYSWWKYFRGTEEPDFAKWSNLTLMSSNIFKLSTCQCEVQHCISWLLGIHFPKRDFYILVKFPSDLDHSWRELWCFTMQFVFRTANTLKI